ncbi:MAG: hypothetical protein HYX65_07920 [Gemmatimonadetes bacterium]|nr:hypothetical protein [Gemmatimonadota bacterium]
MTPPAPSPGDRDPAARAAAQLRTAVTEYRDGGDMSVLQRRLAGLVASFSADSLAAAAEPWRTVPEVAGPIYEKVVAEQPGNARALVALANAYWLAGRGPDKVNEIASRAIAADPANRGGWHLWALSESDQRERTIRWRQVVSRFPDDDLARANLADNAASLASAERDREALEIAIGEYRTLRARATDAAQRDALDKALLTLEGWQP